MMMKRLLILSVLALFLSSTARAYDFEEGGMYYNILSEEDLTCEVTYLYYNSSSNSETYGGDVSIPELVTHNGTTFSVTEIGDYAFYYCSAMTEVTIPESVTMIGKHAFSHCDGLTQVNFNAIACTSDGYVVQNSEGNQTTIYLVFANCANLSIARIGDDVTQIPDYFFDNCTGLTSVTIGESVSKIGSEAFYQCTGLTEITIPNSVIEIGNSVFKGCTGLTEVTIGNSVTSIGSSAFEDCTGLTSVTISNSVTSIDFRAFYQCSGLVEVTIPNSVTEIGNYSFYNCSGLTEVNIPNSVTSIGSYAFCRCTGLTEITIGNSVSEIGGWAFEGCSGLMELAIPSSVTIIGEYAFAQCTSIEEVTIYNGVTSIGEDAFRSCTNLKQVAIPNSVTNMGDGLFRDCTNLKQVKLPDSITSIAIGLFFKCYSLTDVTIPNSVTSIGTAAFEYCTSIKEMIIPNSVTTMGEWVFDGCTGLMEVIIGNSVSTMGEQFFYNCSALESITSLNPEPPVCGSIAFYNVPTSTCVLYVPEGSKEAYASADQWQDFLNIEEIECEVIFPTVQTYEATEVTFNSALLRGLVTVGTEEVLEQGFEYWSEGGEIQTVTSPDLFMALTLTGLEEGTTYTFRAYALTENCSAYGEEMTFTTIKAPTVQTYEATEITENSALLRGTVTVGSEDVLEQGFEYWAEGGEIQTIAMSEQMMAVTLTGLASNTTYIYRAYAKTDGGTTYGEEVTFTTLEDTDAVSDITANGNAEATGYYTTDGKQVPTLQKGMNIIRYSDGTTNKVLVR